MSKQKRISYLACVVALVTLHGLLGPQPALAQTELAKLLASDGEADDRFGWSVAISGGVAVIGADSDDHHGTNSGSAYVFRFNGSQWTQEQQLIHEYTTTEDHFGLSVGVSGDVALIGAPKHELEWPNLDEGAAYVFRFNGTSWDFETMLRPVDIAGADCFGWSVAISGSTAVIGSVFDDDNGPNSGSAYIFNFTGSSWVEAQKLLAFDGAALDEFGYAVAIDGDVAVVGARTHDHVGMNSGSAYVFRFNGSSWVPEQELLASDGAAADLFGSSVAVSGDVAVVGALYHDTRATDDGAAYVFRFNGSSWVQEAKLLASDWSANDRFGEAVAVSGDTVVIGVPADDASNWSGSAYLFRYSGGAWTEEAKLLASDAQYLQYFGTSTAIEGSTALIGSCRGFNSGVATGAVYVFGLCPGDLNGDGFRNVTDFTLFAAAFGSQIGDPNYNAGADMDGDGFVNMTDFTQFAAGYGASCP